jgi:hypothetical protein
MEFVIFPTSICLNSFDFLIKSVLNLMLKMMKDGKDIRLLSEKIYPCESTISINKAYVVFFTMHYGMSRSPHIRINKLKWTRN